MAIMHPNYRDDELDVKISGDGAWGERQLYLELRRQLPDNWHVLYNNNIRVLGKDVQTDFLVFCPGKGVVNVDAKGQGYRYQDNSWYLGDEEDRIFYKAQRAIHTFDDYVRSNLSNGRSWGAYGYLVVFLAQPDLRQEIPGDCSHMLPQAVRDGQLRQYIEGELDRHCEHHASFTSKMCKSILNHFCLKFEFSPFYFEFVNNDRRLESPLTTLQKNIQAAIEANRYVHVTGGAGTGKTVLAMACASSFAARGQRVLYVCYNVCLAENLSLHNQRNGNVIITHFDVLPRILFNQAIQQVIDNGQINWEQTHNRIADMICDRGEQQDELNKFDLILVDEAQDMNQEMLYSLQFIAKEHAKIAFFSDSAQSIFRNDWAFPKEDYPGIETHTLRVNLRNTDRIHEQIVQYSREDTSPGGYISGMRPEFFNESVENLIQRLKNDEGIHPDDIAVLGYRQESIDNVRDRNQEQLYFTSNIREWNNRNRNILKTTVQSFKGMEANVVIIADADQMPNLDDVELNHLRYVGESRAKYRLYLHSPG